MITTKRFKSYWRLIKILGYASLPIVLIILPTDFFDYGGSICLSKSWFGIECYACGMTRATMHLIHLDFQGAWDFNKLSFLVFPLLILFWLKLLLKEFGIIILKWF